MLCRHACRSLPEDILGAGLIVLGGVTAATGFVLWSRGSSAAEEAEAQLRLKLKATDHELGAGLVLWF